MFLLDLFETCGGTALTRFFFDGHGAAADNLHIGLATFPKLGPFVPRFLAFLATGDTLGTPFTLGRVPFFLLTPFKSGGNRFGLAGGS